MGIMARLFRKDVPVCRAGAIEVRAPWIRASASDPAVAGGFLTLTNSGATADRLLSATSPVASSLAIHAIKVVGGDIAMRPLENGLALPPQTMIALVPRGYHLLLGGLIEPLVEGNRVPITLCFERAGQARVEFVVQEPGPIGDQTLLERN